jgi:hypothetical protein
LVREWAAAHLAELLEDWALARAEAALRPIPPLEQLMLKDITSVQPLDEYRIQFEDAVEGIVDLGNLSFRGIFQPLKDPVFFRQVRVDPDLGMIVWPNGADLDPDVLYAQVTGHPITLEQVLG